MEQTRQLDPGQIRQMQVHNRQIGGLVFCRDQPAQVIARGEYLIAFAGQECSQQIKRNGVVLNHQDAEMDF